MSKRVAILQSNYIPWKGYFDLIASVDEFILYDDVQFTKNDWRNRNTIKTPTGVNWLSIPVGQAINRRIRDVEVSGSRWREKHWKTLQINYRRAPCYDEVAPMLEEIYLARAETNLSSINRVFIQHICGFLGIQTPLGDSAEYLLPEGRLQRLLAICEQAGASVYVSGPAAKNYLDEKMFLDRGLQVQWFDYRGYPAYPQLWGEFCHEVSVLDLLFNCGRNAVRFMKCGIQAHEIP